MNARSLLLCTVAGAIVLFVYQTVSHAAVPWHEMTMKPLADTTVAGAKAIRAQAPENGVYFNAYGVFLSVAMTPDFTNKTTVMGPMLARQVGLNLLVVFLLCLLVARLNSREPIAIASGSALAGLAAAAVLQLSDANWYGFTVPYAVVNILDTGLAFFVTGWVIGVVAKRVARPTGVDVLAGAGYATPHSGAHVG